MAWRSHTESCTLLSRASMDESLWKCLHILKNLLLLVHLLLRNCLVVCRVISLEVLNLGHRLTIVVLLLLLMELIRILVGVGTLVMWGDLSCKLSTGLVLIHKWLTVVSHLCIALVKWLLAIVSRLVVWQCLRHVPHIERR